MRKEQKPPSNIRNSFLLAGVVVTSIIYLGWRIFFTIPLGRGALPFAMGAALCAAEAAGVLEAFSNYRNMRLLKVPDKPLIPDEMYPHVDILIATHNEGTELLYKTVNGCIFLKYPDKSKIHIYLCDDMARPEMKELAERMGVGWFGLSGNKDAKAGNLNNAISKTNSPLIVTLDADMIPTSDFLLETVPYFFLPEMIRENGVWRRRTKDETRENYKIGFVQTPQSFYNADMFQFNLYADKNVPNEQDYFFREVNIGRNRTNSAVYAGSNTVISREAIEKAGGIRTGTITEDFATGIDIQAAGYTTYAIDRVVAHGLAPNDVRGLIKQRQRWGRGCVQALRGKRFLFSGLGIRSKLSYCMCGLYWWTFLRRLIYILSPVLFVLFGVVTVECSLFELLIIWLPSYIIYNLAQKLMSGKIRSMRLSNMIDTILFPYLIFPVIFETLGIRMKIFFVTPKEKSMQKNSNIKYATPHIILAAFSAAAIVCCVRNLVFYGNYGGIVVFYWLLVNLYTLINAIVFFAGRVNHRSDERFYAKVPVKLRAGERTICCETADISGNGMAVLISEPVDVLYEGYFTAEAVYKDYKAKFLVKALHRVRVNSGEWKYSFKITECSEENHRQYLQIVFDRDHTLPKVISSTMLKDSTATLKGLVSTMVR